MHRDWDKNQKVGGEVAVPFHWYVHEGCGLKLVIQTFIYNILLKKIVGVLRSTSMCSVRPFGWKRIN